jgi:GNAT superfamily N-acetyltransferase
MLIGMVAFSVLRTLTEGIAFVSDLAVLPVYQRRGIGAVLIEAVRARAQKLGLHTLMVNADRLPFGVRAFFEAESFEALDMLVRPVDE